MNIDQTLQTAAHLMYDQSFRRKVRNKDPDALAKLGMTISGGFPELKVVSSTRDITYLPIPLMPDHYQVSGAELEQIQAGVEVGSTSTVGTVLGSLGTVTSTASTIGTLATAGTAQ